MYPGTSTEISSVIIDGQTVKPGDWVGFKSDIEQSGQIVKITSGQFRKIKLHLHNPDGFQGNYIGGDTETVIDAEDAWL